VDARDLEDVEEAAVVQREAPAEALAAAVAAHAEARVVAERQVGRRAPLLAVRLLDGLQVGAGAAGVAAVAVRVERRRDAEDAPAAALLDAARAAVLPGRASADAEGAVAVAAVVAGGQRLDLLRVGALVLRHDLEPRATRAVALAERGDHVEVVAAAVVERRVREALAGALADVADPEVRLLGALAQVVDAAVLVALVRLERAERGAVLLGRARPARRAAREAQRLVHEVDVRAVRAVVQVVGRAGAVAEAVVALAEALVGAREEIAGGHGQLVAVPLLDRGRLGTGLERAPGLAQEARRRPGRRERGEEDYFGGHA